MLVRMFLSRSFAGSGEPGAGAAEGAGGRAGICYSHLRDSGLSVRAQCATAAASCDVQDIVGLAQALLTVLTDEKMRARLALAARHTALRFTPEAITDRCLRTLCAIMSGLQPFGM